MPVAQPAMAFWTFDDKGSGPTQVEITLPSGASTLTVSVPEIERPWFFVPVTAAFGLNRFATTDEPIKTPIATLPTITKETFSLEETCNSQSRYLLKVNIKGLKT